MDVPEHSARQQIECVHAALSSSWNPTQDRDSDQTRENQSVDDLCQRGSRRVESCVQPVDGAVTGRPARQCDDLEVSISLVRQAVKKFLLSGGRQPTCIEWQEPEFW
ncbi:Imm1 family immunity protein [Streptomyces eurythermus]